MNEEDDKDLVIEGLSQRITELEYLLDKRDEEVEALLERAARLRRILRLSRSIRR